MIVYKKKRCNRQKAAGLKHCKDSKAFIEYVNDMEDIYKILKNEIQVPSAEYW